MEARGFIADTPMIGNSSVRFDPPNPKDPVRLLHAKPLRWLRRCSYKSLQSVTFHKRKYYNIPCNYLFLSYEAAHPETFIHPIKLNEFNKTLRNMYGFTTDEPIQAGHETRYLTSMRWEDFVQVNISICSLRERHSYPDSAAAGSQGFYHWTPDTRIQSKIRSAQWQGPCKFLNLTCRNYWYSCFVLQSVIFHKRNCYYKSKRH